MVTPSMTPGQQALAEAARIEQARIYGTTCPEHRSTDVHVDIASVPVTQGRPLSSFTGPAAAEVIADLAEALSPVRAVREIA